MDTFTQGELARLDRQIDAHRDQYSTAIFLDEAISLIWLDVANALSRKFFSKEYHECTTQDFSELTKLERFAFLKTLHDLLKIFDEKTEIAWRKDDRIQINHNSASHRSQMESMIQHISEADMTHRVKYRKYRSELLEHEEYVSRIAFEAYVQVTKSFQSSANAFIKNTLFTEYIDLFRKIGFIRPIYLAEQGHDIFRTKGDEYMQKLITVPNILVAVSTEFNEFCRAFANRNSNEYKEIDSLIDEIGDSPSKASAVKINSVEFNIETGMVVVTYGDAKYQSYISPRSQSFMLLKHAFANGGVIENTALGKQLGFSEISNTRRVGAAIVNLRRDIFGDKQSEMKEAGELIFQNRGGHFSIN